MGRKSLVRQQRRASERNGGSSSPLYAPTEKHKPTSQQNLILAAMAMKALSSNEPGAIWKTPLLGGLAAIEFRASADISLKDYHEQESSVDFETHRVLVWERREKPGEALMMILSLNQLAVIAGMES